MLYSVLLYRYTYTDIPNSCLLEYYRISYSIDRKRASGFNIPDIDGGQAAKAGEIHRKSTAGRLSSRSNTRTSAAGRPSGEKRSAGNHAFSGNRAPRAGGPNSRRQSRTCRIRSGRIESGAGFPASITTLPHSPAQRKAGKALYKKRNQEEQRRWNV